MNNTAAPLMPFLLGIEVIAESAYLVYAAVNVFFGLIFAFLLLKGSKQKSD